MTEPNLTTEQVKEVVAELVAELTDGYIPRMIVREVYDVDKDVPTPDQHVTATGYEILMDDHPPLVLYTDELLDIYDFDANEFKESDYAMETIADIQARIEDILKSQA
ncbi:MAG: hypothetical protein KatS3mg015_0092 [Fimbriimonadales bacterium]|nr:MAG: hypothetical protein KatS3mg015_0092 [Fimbriimonadales bacterium]